MTHPRHFALLLLAGCAAAPAELAPPDPATAPRLDPADYAATGGGVFDPRSADPLWHSDDAVEFALRLRKGDEEHRWLLRLEVLLDEDLITRVGGDDVQIELWEEKAWTYHVTSGGERRERELRSRCLPVRVEVRDASGTALTRSLVKLPVRLLGRGMLPAIDLARATANATATAAEVDMEPIVSAVLGAMALLQVVQEDDALADYFWQVVEKPSLWSIVTGLGVAATMAMEFEHSVPATRMPTGVPAADRAFVVPLRIDVNDHPALLADVLVVDSARPYALCGGMVAAVARHPSNPDLSFELQILSAHLGSEPTRK